MKHSCASSSKHLEAVSSNIYIFYLHTWRTNSNISVNFEYFFLVIELIKMALFCFSTLNT